MHQASPIFRSAFVCFLASMALLVGCAAHNPGGMVVADHRLAADAGARILAQGGNASDAAIATSLALSVVRPESCGIGGGGFMLIHLQDHPEFGTIDTAINYRETCPAGIGPDTYAKWNDPEASRVGGRAVAVPGTIAGLYYAHQKYGELDWAEVCAPAIEIAEQGFHADRYFSDTSREQLARFEKNPDWKERFPLVWNELSNKGQRREGDLIQNPAQARALRLIASEGANAFYTGDIARAIVSSVARDGGVLTMDDLANYTPVETKPIRIPWKGQTLLVMPPPSSGGIAIAQLFALMDMLNIFVSPTGWYDPMALHLLAEASKHAFANRAKYLADPAFVEVPVGELLSEETIARMAMAIDPERAFTPTHYGSSVPLPADAGTSHFCVVDAQGNAVSCTETINLSYGSLLDVAGYGFCLNNEMDDFTTISGASNAFGLVQSDDNLPSPGKRPLSSMSPSMVLDRSGRVVALAGGSGGPRIISGTAQVLIRIQSGATASEAVGAPRFHHQWLPDTLQLESNIAHVPPDSLREALEAKGHDVSTIRNVAAVQAIRWDNDRKTWDGASDPRKGLHGVRRVLSSEALLPHKPD